ncbi:hypothetical protein JCGZ_08105 [Jatropha curcas]|uniref:Uncharacterized protein n=1 Tax=Jatropha curcas TaxID=180498 RepID=A0A067KY98_JATCU|nr:hypothetical protein JCGZ_08105 [Jatropha curcas]
MELFVKRAPQQVVEAMRQTVTNMIGTLPPQFFAVTVTTVAENLAQLMYSVMMTGYMFKNAQYRLELQQSLEQVALPEAQDEKMLQLSQNVPDYAPVRQKNVSGEVIRWNNVSGAEKIDAKKYIELLEAELEELNRQVGRKSADGENELLEYLKSLEPQNLKKIKSGGEEGFLKYYDAMKEVRNSYTNPEFGNEATEFVGFTSSCNFGIYGIDFGWGKPIWTACLAPDADESHVSFVFLIDRRVDKGSEAWVLMKEDEFVLKLQLQLLMQVLLTIFGGRFGEQPSLTYGRLVNKL